MYVSEKHLSKGDIELTSKISHMPLKRGQIPKILLVKLQEESVPPYINKDILKSQKKRKKERKIQAIFLLTASVSSSTEVFLDNVDLFDA